MKLINTMVLGSALLMNVQCVHAAIALDRTRAVFDGSQKSISLNIKNDNTRLPYLAQAWLEDESLNRSNELLTVIPPVQRLEAGAKSQIRVSSLPSVAKLPQDRESLFYFNVREIPPRSEKANVMQIALQTKIKLFYRPKAIEATNGKVWQEHLVLKKTPTGYEVENPTPYYITIIGLSGKPTGESAKEFQSEMVAPKSTAKLISPAYSTPYLTYVNDYGGRPVLKFNCTGDICHTVKA